MLKRKIKYTDYNGVEREEEFLFNLNKAEVMEMQLGVSGGFQEQIRKIIEAKDTPSLISVFKEIILKAYGEKSADGKRFIKVDDNGVKLALHFSQTEAYSNLYMELATDDVKAAEFVNGIVPADMKLNDQQINEIKEELNK